MSFAYLAFYTGDYLRDTRHLTPLKHGVYMLALMHCWDSRGPMPLDEQECSGICNCRSADEVEALRYILGRFFVKMPDGHYNKRMAEEIERANILSDKRSGAAQERWKARESIKAMHLHSKSKATAPPLPPSPSLPQRDKEPAPSVLVKRSAFSVPDCPYRELLDEFHSALPMLPRIVVFENSRKQPLRARWVEVCASEKFDQAAGIEFFRDFYRMVSKSAFLTGRSSKWKASFDWLHKPTNFAKTIEGNYQGEKV